MPALRLDDLLLILFPVFCLAQFRKIEVDARVLIFVLIIFSFQISIVVGTLLGYPASLGDQFYLVRILKYIGAVVLGTMLITQLGRVEALSFFIRSSLLVGLGTAAIAVQQFFDLGSLNAIYVPIVAPTQFHTLVGGYAWPRPVGMIGNPNELGFVFVLLGLSGVILRLVDKNARKGWLVVSLIMFLCAALTLSRSSIISGLAAFLILLGGVFFAGFAYSGGVIKYRMAGFKVAAISAGLIGALMAWLVLDQSVAAQVTWRFSPEHYGSFEARFSAWEANMEGWRNSPVLGIGPLRHAGVFAAADNEHFLLLRTGGVLLFSLVMLLIFVGIVAPGVDRYSRLGSLAIAVATVLYMIPAVAFYSLVAFPYMLILFVLLGPLRVATVRI